MVWFQEAKSFPFWMKKTVSSKSASKKVTGWVSEDYVVVATEYVTAESIEEEKARIAEEEKAREDAKKAAQAAEERMKAEGKSKGREECRDNG